MMIAQFLRKCIITVIGNVMRMPFAMRPEINSNDFVFFWVNQLADSNSIFVAADFFFERFEFLVCSKFNLTQCGLTCACAVACLRPHNSISNVVVSVTTCIFIYTNIFRFRDM